MAISAAQARRLFPGTKKVNYLFNGGYCLCSTPVENAVKRFLKEDLDGFNQANWDRWSSDASLAYKLFGDLIGASKEEIVSVQNTSVGMGLIALMLDPKPGTNVVLDDLEYQTVFPFTMREKRGVEIRVVKSTDGRMDMKALAEQVDDRTSAVVVSAVSCWNGYRYNLKELSEIAHRHKAYLVVDAAQQAGAVRIDVEREGVDFLATAAHKWLLGLPGIGFLYVRKELIELFDPPTPGWLSAADPFAQDVWKLDFPKTAQRFESGMQNLPLLAGVRASLQLIHDVGPETIEREILKRSGYLVTELENLGLKVCTPAEDEHRAGLVTFLTRRHENMAQQFLKESIYVFHQPKAVVKSLRWPTGGFRVDPTFFNTFEELDSFLSCVKKNK